LRVKAIIPIILAARNRGGKRDKRGTGESMLTHAQVWSAIDRLAARAGLTASGLARRAGLDPTTFNKSKRVTTEGRARWPSTESISKALAATGTPLETFVSLIDGDTDTAAIGSVPLIGFAEAGETGHFDKEGVPVGAGWQKISFPAANGEQVYALKIAGQSMAPAYRDGDIIIVSPAAPMRRGDRVVVRTKSGEMIAKELKRRSEKSIELKSLDGEHGERALAITDIVWIARILWVSQ
jgi:phage repressor protein C with HTH and peptisase S24 domain